MNVRLLNLLPKFLPLCGKSIKISIENKKYSRDYSIKIKKRPNLKNLIRGSKWSFLLKIVKFYKI